VRNVASSIDFPDCGAVRVHVHRRRASHSFDGGLYPSTGLRGITFPASHWSKRNYIFLPAITLPATGGHYSASPVAIILPATGIRGITFSWQLLSCQPLVAVILPDIWPLSCQPLPSNQVYNRGRIVGQELKPGLMGSTGGIALLGQASPSACLHPRK
jgi:hypothetical protein